MSLLDSQSPTYRSIEKDIVHSGFRPSLFAVAPGSYASNQVYGSSAASVGNYDTITDLALSNASVRLHDKNVDFSVKLYLDTTSDPGSGFTTNSELRVKVKSLTTGDPARYLKGLPAPDVKYPLPLFEDVEITDASTGQVFTGIPIGDLEARLLHGGELALVSKDLTATPASTAALVKGLISAALGAEISVTCISIRGSYRTANHV